MKTSVADRLASALGNVQLVVLSNVTPAPPCDRVLAPCETAEWCAPKITFSDVRSFILVRPVAESDLPQNSMTLRWISMVGCEEAVDLH
jgi:hypothetical protein